MGAILTLLFIDDAPATVVNNIQAVISKNRYCAFLVPFNFFTSSIKNVIGFRSYTDKHFDRLILSILIKKDIF